MIVKVGKVTNLSDARYCAGMNVDLLGFVTIDNQENYLAPKAFQDIRGWLSGPQVVAEVYGLKSRSELDEIIENYKPDYLELSEQELPFVSNTLPLILRWTKSIEETSQIPNLYALIVEKTTLQHSGDNTSNIRLLVETEKLSDVEEVNHIPSVKGIVLNGTQEESPGLKDYDHLSEILESLEVD